MTDVKSLIAEARRTAKHPSEDRDWQNIVLILADALEATVKEMHARELHHFEEEQARAEAEAERDRYRAEAESARKTGERILVDALRYRAAIERIDTELRGDGRSSMLIVVAQGIVNDALDEGKTDD